VLLWVAFDARLRQGFRLAFVKSSIKAKNLNIICAIGFAILGLFLSFAVPNFDKIYASMYSNWNTSTEFRVQAFHWPSYVWLLLFLIPAIVIYILGKVFHGVRLNFLNNLASILFFTIFATVLIWTYSFIFCHPWGCASLFF
jgi:type II secretory pathway component PulF